MKDARKATLFAGLAILVLLGGCFLALLFPDVEIALVAAAFVGYVACGRRAMILWRADEKVSTWAKARSEEDA